MQQLSPAPDAPSLIETVRAPRRRIRISPFNACVTLAVLFGFFVRARHVFSYSFPLNDGGLFYVMVRDLQAAHYHLPAYTSYNAAGIPFAYPPLGFYVAGVLNDVTRIPLFEVFRFLPLVISALTVAAFWPLAKAILPSRWAALAALFCFALVPRGFIWLIMGGGVTRGFGLLFTLLALYQIHQMYTCRRRRAVLLAALFSGLTLLSHSETAAVLLYSAVLFLLAFGRHRFGVLSSLAVGVGALLISSPWWVGIIATHGIEPLLVSGQTAPNVFADYGTRVSLLLTVARFGLGASQEPLFPIIAVLGAFGALACLTSRRLLLPIWWIALVLLDARGYPTYVTMPLAFLAGIGLTEVLWPLLTRARVSATTWSLPELPANGHAPSKGPTWRHRPVLVAGVVFACLILYATFAASTTDSLFGSEETVLVGLSPNEIAAMQWAGSNTPSSSRFLVISNSDWASDRASEWFPLLAGRVSVATVQGREWLPGWNQRVQAYTNVQACSNLDTSCLELWSTQQGLSYTHIFVPKTPDGQCCLALLNALHVDQRYQLLYDGPGATVFSFPQGEMHGAAGPIAPEAHAGGGTGRPASVAEPPTTRALLHQRLRTQNRG